MAGVCDPRQETAANLARMMIGREIPTCEHGPSATFTDGRLAITNLSVKSEDPFGIDLHGIDLTVHGGEIVGIAGVSGNGQHELMAALSGETLLTEPSSIVVCGIPVGAFGPAGAANSAYASCRKIVSVVPPCRAWRLARTAFRRPTDRRWSKPA